MGDNKQLLLLGNLSPGDDHTFLERIQACINHRNSHGSHSTKALDGISGEQIKQIIVGPNHIAFLFNDNTVGRITFDVNEVKPPLIASSPEKSVSGGSNNNSSSNLSTVNNPDPNASTSNASVGSNTSSTAPPGSSANQPFASAAVVNANRTAKIRRVMMASRRAGSQFAARSGVIVDRGRAMIPASSIPEDLIAQAQVVLQGKSREVIVRELQRTNLNVNEAVNNLLSREDDEEDLEDGADAYLPEELLSLLDAGLRSSEGLMEQEGLYTTGEGYEYMMARELGGVRRRGEGGRSDIRKERQSNETSNTVREKFVFGDAIEYWTGCKENPLPPYVKKFVKIAAFQGELLALTDNGMLYGWSWDRKTLGDKVPHSINSLFLGQSKTEYFTDFETSAYRAVVLTNASRIGSFVDSRSLGKIVSDALFIPLVEIPNGEVVESLHVCPMFAAVRTKNALYWWGINPFNERRRVFDKHKNKAKKSLSTSSSDIKVGAEVRTKSNPIYAANSIAVNLQSSVPMVGIMMESAFSINQNEFCRFRIYTPEQFDQLKDETKSKDDKKAMNLSLSRKRGPPSDETPIKETAWPIKDVFFIHEEPCNDIGIVQIIDGPICGIHFKSYIDEKKRSGDGSEDIKKLRLIRKDELVVGGGKQPASPVTFERTLQRVYLPHGIRKVISVVVDNSGFRILVEKKGRLHLMRMSTLGKVASDHLLPISCSAVCGPHDNHEQPSKTQLVNYGDDNVILLRDYNGALIPLIRNAVGGYCEPPFLGFTGMHHLSVGLRYFKSNETSSAVISSAPIEKGSKNDTSRSGTKLILIATMIAPSPESIQPSLTSLMQLVLFCDADGVKHFLKRLETLSSNIRESEFKNFIDEKVVRVRADGNRTILHAAVMGAFARINANQADVEPSSEVPGQSLLTLQEALDMTEADAHREKMDRQWKNMIAGAVSDGAKQLAKEAAALEKRNAKEETPKATEVETMEVEEEFTAGKPVADLKTRQKNSIEILKLFTENEIIQKCLPDLLHVRDIHGHTPFISAIQNRAYGAASVLWSSMRKLYSKSNVEEFTTHVYNHAIHTDDSPLFILCYNDTCSFTWTGDEHINQDIFECKTCGLTGSLCCCTECANTCHRNHDCKLKRTSPTAYCDCWEKCACKALVAGNDTQREHLLRELMEHTNLISQANSRGEHLLLFLAKTVGRQLVEQENFTRRNKNRNNAPSSMNATGSQEIPERDLEPPKFAQRAFRLCLSEWAAVKSLILIGVKQRNDNNILSEELFHLGSQNGSTHLDKFVYTLLSKCQEAHLDILINTLVYAANKKVEFRDSSIDFCISRFIRSVIRIFALITLVAPSTLALTINSVACNADEDTITKFSTSTGEISRPPTTRAIAISGVLSLVRSIPILNDRNSKEHKKKTVNAFVLKCRRIFQALATYSIAELLNTADAYMGPVRTGFINPSCNILRAMHNTDPLDYIERYFMLEQDLSSALDANGAFRINRRRYGSRRDTDDEPQNNAETSRAPMAQLDSEESESDSENEAASRRFSSQGSLHGHTAENLSNVVHNYRRAVESAAPGPPANQNPARREVPPVASAAPAVEAGEYSTDSLSSASDDDDSEESNDEESENERAFDAMDGFNNEFDDDDEMRDNDDDEDEYYDDENEEEHHNDFVEAEGSEDENENEFEGEDVLRVIPAVEVPSGGENENNSNQQNPDNVEENQPPLEDSVMEMYVPDRAAEEEILQHANEEVAIDIPVEETGDVSIQSANPSENQRSRSRSVRVPSRPPVTARSLTWAVPPNINVFTGESFRREDNNTGELAIRTNNANTNENSEPPSSQRMNKQPPSIPTDDSSGASSEKTAFQFATVFAALLKLVDDLMLQITQHSSYAEKGQAGIPTMLRLDNDAVRALRNHLDAKLTSTWAWLTNILDKVESQLKFGSSLNASPAISLLHGEHERDVKKPSNDEKRKYKSKSESTSSGSKKEHQHGRRDFIQYFFSIARSHASENGDELPIIEYRALKTAAFVAEAFLFHANVIEIIDSRIQAWNSEIMEVSSKIESSSKNTENESISAKNLKKFYQRSNSICYPCISYAESHNAFQYRAEECLPLASRPQLLQPDVEKYHLFTLPLPQRTRKEHNEVAHNHGITDPTFHSLGELPTSYSELRELLKKGEETVPRRNLLRTYISDQSTISDFGAFTVDQAFALETSASRLPLQRLLGRWSNVFALITQMYTEDLTTYCGGDAAFSVILVETADFHFRQAQFRRRIEKLKNGQLRDLVLSGIVRDKPSLIVQTFRLLNQQYTRRISSSNNSSGIGGMAALRILARGGLDSNNGIAPPPLASHKVKVTFKDEPGEGTGVARSFYSAVGEALTTLSNMPQDGFEPIEDSTDKSKRSVAATNTTTSSTSTSASTPRRVTKGILHTLAASIPPGKRAMAKKMNLSYNTAAAPYLPLGQEHKRGKHGEKMVTPQKPVNTPPEELLGERLYTKVSSFEPTYAQKVVGVLLESSFNEINNLLSCDDILKYHTVEAIKALQADGYTNSFEKENDVPICREDAPFFLRLDCNGHYVPIPATCSENRLNGFRNVGRMIGICLQQREIFPIQLARHVLKFILNQPLTWFDLAFFDPNLFDSMRSLIFDDKTSEAQTADFYELLSLTFTMSYSQKEGGKTIELKPGGSNISLTRENVLEFFYNFVETRLLGPSLPVLEAIRTGVFDVIPADALNNLTPEDLRLILCGSPEINVYMLESYTKFLDESSSSNDVIEKYKQTFWSIVNKLTDQEKQDLIFFWTGSPTLPATEEEFQPLPTIMVRPSDQNLHLPTANTCISRLYLPLYSSKKILRAKLLLAIKARNFGFV